MSRHIARRFFILLSGTTAAQLLPVATAPIVARAYSAAEFGVFGLYIAAAAICTTVANLKYENAILSTHSRATTRAVLGLSLCVSGALGLVLAVGAVVATQIRWTSALPSSSLLTLFLPFSLLLAGVQQALSNIAFQCEHFSAVARSRFVAAAVTAAASLLAAWLHPTATMLIIATLSGQCAGALLLARLQRNDTRFIPIFRRSRLTAVAQRHWRFAMYTSPADLLNALASNLPALSLGALYGTAATGAYVLAQRLLGTPLMLIGSAFADLYRQRVGRQAAEGQPYWNSSLRMLWILAVAGAIALAVVLPLAKPAATLILGAQWHLVGDICLLMIWVYVARFIASPLTFTFYLAHRHQEDLILQALSATAVGAAYFAARSQQWPLLTYVTGVALALSVMYAIYGIRAMQFSQQSLRPTR